MAVFTFLWMREIIREQEIKPTGEKGAAAITKLMMTVQPSKRIKKFLLPAI